MATIVVGFAVLPMFLHASRSQEPEAESRRTVGLHAAQPIADVHHDPMAGNLDLKATRETSPSIKEAAMVAPQVVGSKPLQEPRRIFPRVNKSNGDGYGLAIATLVSGGFSLIGMVAAAVVGGATGLAWLAMFGWFGGIVLGLLALVLGLICIFRSKEKSRGKGFAILGMVLGSAGLLGLVLVIWILSSYWF